MTTYVGCQVNETTTGVTQDTSVTVGAGEGLAVFVVCYAFNTTPVISSVVWNTSETLQQIYRGVDAPYSASNENFGIYYLANPTAGTHNVRVTVSGAVDKNIFTAIFRFSGHNTSATPNYAKNASSNTNTFAATVSSVANDLVLGTSLMFRTSSWTTPPTVDAAQTIRGNTTDASGRRIYATSGNGLASSTTVTWTKNADTVPSAWLGLLAITSASSSATITLTPDPATAAVGGSTSETITRSTAAPAGGVVYDLASDNTDVATVPATVTMTQGQTQISFNVTGVGIGEALISATSQTDPAETDQSSVTVSGTRKLRVLVDASAAGVTGVSGVVFAAPTGGAITGTEYGEFTGKAFEVALVNDGGVDKAEIKVPVADFGGNTLTVQDVPAVELRTDTHTTGITTVDVSVIEE